MKKVQKAKEYLTFKEEASSPKTFKFVILTQHFLLDLRRMKKNEKDKNVCLPFLMLKHFSNSVFDRMVVVELVSLETLRVDFFKN